jgi:hypothetical protein
MKKLFFWVILLGFVFALIAIFAYAQQPDSAARKIVVFQKDFTDEAAQATLIKEKGAEKIKHLRLINAWPCVYRRRQKVRFYAKPKF